MGSRIRENPAHIFECFCEVVIPNESTKNPWILQKYPEDYNDQEMLKSIPEFACPCEFQVTKSGAIQHFSFVLTSLDSKWSFGYCRYDPDSPTLLVFLSSLPWHETFYKILNRLSLLMNDKKSSVVTMFLESIYNSSVPEPGFNLHVTYDSIEFVVYCPNHLKLPSIPENRNLTEYFNAVDARNMIIIFASMLHERRIIVISKKLSRLSACVQAANSLIYPMHWQHIFIPVLPKHLVDYLSAPMPFLIGVPYWTYMDYSHKDLSETVILHADENFVKTPFNDIQTLPPEIVTPLKRSLRYPNLVLGDGVARAFMRALVQLIGGYRDSLKFNLGQRISFDADAFLQTRPSSLQPFLETMLHLQIFQQFIEDRLDMLNSGTGFNDEFEYEVNSYEVHSSHTLKAQYKEWVSTMKKEGGAFLKNVKSKANPAVKHAYKSVKDKSKRAYKDIRSRIQDMQKHPSHPDLRFDHNFSKPKSAPSSPTMPRINPFGTKKMLNHDGKNAAVDGHNFLPSSISVSGIRRYKMLTIDEMSLHSECSSPNGNTSPGIQRLDMDLMGELKDIIYRRRSLSTDNLNTLAIDDTSRDHDVITGFKDPFSDPNDAFLPAPLPPPRSRKGTKSTPVQEKAKDLLSDMPAPTTTNNSVPPEPVADPSDSLIQLESLEDVDIFDPLNENTAKVDKLLPFMTSKPANDARIAELKNTIQNLSATPMQQRMPFVPTQAYFPARVAHPTVMLPGFSQRAPFIPNYTVEPNGVMSSENHKETLPKETRLSASTFFVGRNELSKDEKDLLDDYGLGSSPIFTKNSVEAKTECTPDPFSSFDDKSSRDSKSRGNWQKFA